ncbi:hypothetical protein BpHYR1_010621 [Brachionus plicatilis]|uniref:Uncharacterized protein n=1 Tax=Brachionus plicatilis TaxID=10195 RepID=A0A3M7S6Q8_BRAPC|nr:hypothetical protein BpHYR1_010621 [Brachionus plicatilis]
MCEFNFVAKEIFFIRKIFLYHIGPFLRFKKFLFLLFKPIHNILSENKELGANLEINRILINSSATQPFSVSYVADAQICEGMTRISDARS